MKIVELDEKGKLVVTPLTAEEIMWVVMNPSIVRPRP